MLDVVIYTLSVYLTEAYTSSFTSPFYSFFAFLVFSAMVRWGWKAAMLTAATATALYLVAGIAAAGYGLEEFDAYRFGRRAAYLLILSMVLTWFGVNQQGMSKPLRRVKELEQVPDDGAPPIEAALRYAAERIGAQRVLLAWWEHEEPWMMITRLEDGHISEERYGPLELESVLLTELDDEPVLFDVDNNRALTLRKPTTLSAHPIDQPVNPRFADRFDVRAGLRIAISSADYRGELFVLEVPGNSVDDIRVAQEVGHEIFFALDRYSMMSVTEDAAVAEARLTIARDLHDTVVQVLAGAAFRLEALRSWVRAGRDPEPEIIAVLDALLNEQKSMRGVIARLRGGRNSSHVVNIRASLHALLESLSHQWSIECRFNALEGELQEPAWLEHELQHIVREAVANAVRHGKSTAVTVDLAWDAREIRLRIGDNGTGLKTAGNQGPRLNTRPWSIHERLKNVGGTLSLYSNETGTKLSIALPRDEQQ